MAPSAAPAPTSVCSSSMKRMISPCESSISLRTALRRSSNSPRYFAPASMAPRSSATTRLFFRDFGHVAGDDALREAFDDGGFADAGLADQHRIIFRAAGEHLDDAADFFVAADDGIELAAARLLGQIASVALQRLVLGFGILVGHLLRAADHGERFQDGVVGGAVAGEDLLRGVALEMRDREQQVFGGNVFVLEIRRFFESLVEQFVGLVRERGLGGASGNFGKFFELAINLGQHGLRANADLLQDGRHNAFLVFEQGRKQVQRQQFRVAVLGGQFVRTLDSFLRFDGKFVPADGHNSISPSSKKSRALWPQQFALDSAPDNTTRSGMAADFRNRMAPSQGRCRIAARAGCRCRCRERFASGRWRRLPGCDRGASEGS